MKNFVVMSVCLLSLSCQPVAEKVAQLDEDEVIQVLTARANAFSQAYMDGDATAMTAIYTEDAAIFPTNSNVIRGKEAIQQYWTLPAGRSITNHKLTPQEVVVSDSMASDYGVYEVSGINGETAWGPVGGKYVVVWKLGKDGIWRMYLDMWNSLPSTN